MGVPGTGAVISMRQNKVKIKKIDFHGNRRFTDKKLRSKMEDTKESHWWNTAEFIQEKFDADLEKVIDFYREKGYINATITDYKIDYTQDHQNLFIDIYIDEGEKFYVGTIAFEGNEVFSTKFLSKQLKFKENSRYNQKKIDKTLEELYNVYAEDGYIFSSIINSSFSNGAPASPSTQQAPLHAFKLHTNSFSNSFQYQKQGAGNDRSGTSETL